MPTPIDMRTAKTSCKRPIQVSPPKPRSEKPGKNPEPNASTIAVNRTKNEQNISA